MTKTKTRKLTMEEILGLEVAQVRCFEEAVSTYYEIGMDLLTILQLEVRAKASVALLQSGISIEGRLSPDQSAQRIRQLAFRLRIELDNLESYLNGLCDSQIGFTSKWQMLRARTTSAHHLTRIELNEARLNEMITKVLQHLDDAAIGARRMLKLAIEAQQRVDQKLRPAA